MTTKYIYLGSSDNSILRGTCICELTDIFCLLCFSVFLFFVFLFFIR